MKIKILLVGREENTAYMQSEISSDDILVVGAVNNEAQVLDKIKSDVPDIVMLSLDQENAVFRVCEQIYLLCPRCIPVLMVNNPDLKTLQRAMHVGIHNVFPASINPDDLVSQLKDIVAGEAARISVLQNGSQPNMRSRVITVFGAKGGIGKTSLAVNLAVSFARRGLKVALLDMDMQFGDVGVFLDLQSYESLSDLLEEQSNPTADIVRKHLAIHSSGVNVLCAPRSPEYAENISAWQIEKIITSLRAYFDYIVIDTAALFNDINLTCIDCATIIMFVTGLDLSILRNSQKGIELINSLKQKNKVKVILNRDVQADVTKSDVERILGCPVWHSIGNDYRTAVAALNEGVPFVAGFPKSKISHDVDDIASQVEAELSVDGSRKVKHETKQKHGFWR